MSRPVAAGLGAAVTALLVHPGPPGPVVWLVLAAALAVGATGLVLRRGDRLLVGAIAGAAIAARLALLPGVVPGEAVLPEGDGPWRAEVESLASTRDGQQPATLRLVAEDVRVAATLPRYPAIEPGQLVTVDGAVQAPPEGPYGDYLRRIGIAGTLRSRSLVVSSAGAGPALERLRREAAAALVRAIPEPEAGLAAGILIGLRDRVDRQLAADFTTAGASHVVAISGWNIAILGASVGALGGRLDRRRRSLLTAGAIVAYVLFVGASPSVLRAAAMAGVVLLARESGRAGRATAALAWAVAILLLIDPALIRDAGFQLSTLATAGLIAWATPLTAWISRITRDRLPGWMTEGLGVSLAAQAATLPIILASFGRLSLVAPVVNLLVVPLIAPAMAAGAIALLSGLAVQLPGIPGAVAVVGGLPAWGLLATVVATVRWFAALPLASVELAPPSGVLAGVVATVAIAVVGTSAGRRLVGSIRRDDRSRAPLSLSGERPTSSHDHRPAGARASGLVRASAAVLAGAIAITGVVLVHRPDGRTRIVVLDVGQGDAILLEGSRGGRILVDGGPDPDRLLVALDERLPPWDRRVDAVILTHPHEDHVAGLALLLARYRVGRVLEPGMHGPGPGYAAWDERLANGAIPYGRLATGDRLTLDDARLTVLWPDPGTVPAAPADTGTAINNVSVVLLGEVDGRRFLLSGDIEEGVDPTIVARGLPSVDLLKIAHHGSRTASTDAFLEAVRPAVAVASAGADNRYGHPNPETLARIAAGGARVLRTDRDGTVEIALQRSGVSVRTSGRRSSTTARTASTERPIAAATTAWACGIQRSPRAPGARPAAGGSGARPQRPPSRGLYHRPDDGPRAHGRRPPSPDPRSPGLVPAPLVRGGRGRGMARRPDRARRRADRPIARRVRGAPPRCRQAGVRGRPRPPPPAWGRLRRLAGTPRSPRACAGGGGPPGHPARGRRPLPTLGRLCQPRGADRGLRGQAGRAAAPTDGGPVRIVGAPLSHGRPWLDGGHADRDPSTRRAARGGRLPCGRDPARGGRPVALDRRRASGSGATALVSRPALGYFFGDDGYGLERSADAVLDRLREGGGTVDRWRTAGDAVSIGRLAERVGTASLFGGGTLVILVDPAPLLRSREDREAMAVLLRTMAPGNGLVFIERTDGSNRRAAAMTALEKAVREAGGQVRELRAPKEGQLSNWIEQRARERGITLAPGAARELATRVGGFVREGDVDRRGQGELAVGELTKLALRRPDGTITVEDVRALVAEVVPGSTWAFLDAVGSRRVLVALELLDRLLDATPDLVVLVQLHRRVRELIEVADHLAAGATPGSLVRTLGLKPFRADRLVEQARTWPQHELDLALEGLVDLDATIRGAPGMPPGYANRRLAWTMWVAERVGRLGSPASSVGARVVIGSGGNGPGAKTASSGVRR